VNSGWRIMKNETETISRIGNSTVSKKITYACTPVNGNKYYILKEGGFL